ncbi:transposase [Candidatus Sodalis pierantonius]|uniref:transposase n=1 Tax=Candidatus Sodalis pierantonii TaxID=1486991 RepID=UPI0009005BF0|nr:transposase [Candidatus Sodalis pierantonius]
MFPTDDAVKKVVWLAIQAASQKWTMPLRDWRMAMSRFIIEFGDRLESLFRNLCICLILICSIQHQKQVNLWTKNSCRLWLTNWPKISKPLKISVTSIGC